MASPFIPVGEVVEVGLVESIGVVVAPVPVPVGEREPVPVLGVVESIGVVPVEPVPSAVEALYVPASACCKLLCRLGS